MEDQITEDPIQIERPPSLSEIAKQRIKAKILTTEYEPGQRLILERLASDLGVSRTPIRDALMKLESDGFVISTVNRSPRVAPITRQLVRDLYQVRKPLECLAVRLSTPRIPESELERLGRLLDEIKESEENSYEKHFRADTELHRLFRQHSGNEWLRRELQPISEHIYRVRCFAMSVPGDHLWQSHLDHRKMLGAIKERDVRKAEELMEEHMHGAAERIARLVDQAISMSEANPS